MFGGHMQKYLHWLSIFPFLCLLLWREDNRKYYWAKYGMSQTPRENLIYPTDFHAALMIWIM